MPRKNLEQYKQEVYDLVGDEYTILGDEYKTNKDHILTRHNLCGNEYMVTPNGFLYGKRCPVCSRMKQGDARRNTIEGFRKTVELLGNREYELLSTEYHNNKEKLEFKHLECGNAFMMSANTFQQGYRCPHCNKFKSFNNHEQDSKGETIIEDYLKKHKIIYEREKSFEDLYYKRILKFDFYLPKKRIIIECDGSKHFKLAQTSNFSKTRDWLKNYYAEFKKISLFRLNGRVARNVQNSYLDCIFQKPRNLELLRTNRLYYYDHKTDFTANSAIYYLLHNYNYFLEFESDIKEAENFWLGTLLPELIKNGN